MTNHKLQPRDTTTGGKKKQTRRQQIRLWDKTYYQTIQNENYEKHTKQQKLPIKPVWKSANDIAIGNITLQKISIQINNKSIAIPTQTKGYQPSIGNTRLQRSKST